MTDTKAVLRQALARLIWWESTYGEPTETEDLLHLSLREAIAQPAQTNQMDQFRERCRLSETCLPDSPYRKMLTFLHDEMLAVDTKAQL